jgi:hypothetical protein
MSKLALWISRHWPFSTYNRLTWPVQLWLIGAGSRAFCEEIYGPIA